MEALLRDLASAGGGADAVERTVEIPVCYGGEYGPDLEDVARHAGLSPGAWWNCTPRRNTRPFPGILPRLSVPGRAARSTGMPRLAAPRTLVPAGSVAIGGSQAGIYPMDSPGGWRIIGRTPLRLFDVQASPPALLAMGDRVRFRPIREGAR